MQSYAVIETSFQHTGTSFNMLCLSAQKNINNKAQNKFLCVVVVDVNLSIKLNICVRYIHRNTGNALVIVTQVLMFCS
jgi:hypothetical protein